METKYLKPAQWANREGITRQRVNTLLNQKRIPGVVSEQTMLGDVHRYIPGNVTLADVVGEGVKFRKGKTHD